MRALRKGQARPWCLQPGIRGEVRLVERAFGIGPSALTEAMGMPNHHFAAAACSAQSDSLPLTDANLCNRAEARAIPGPGRGTGIPGAARAFRARVPRSGWGRTIFRAGNSK